MERKQKRPPGRPATGKRSNPEYAQHSVWLPGSLYGDVLKGLVTPDGKRYEFSSLVESLLRQWLRAGRSCLISDARACKQRTAVTPVCAAA
jgi:hypothetical protein